MCGVFLILVTWLFPQNYALGWVKTNPKDLVEKADVILIGEISGPIGVERTKLPQPPNPWVTNWKVQVRYYLKGSQNNREMIVSTLGAKNQPHVFFGFDNRFLGSTILSPNDFGLDIKGNLVLLFLQKTNSKLEPSNPQGIIGLSANQTMFSDNKSLNGEKLLKQYTISDPSLAKEEIKQLQDFIKRAPVAAPSVNVPIKYSAPANYSTFDKIIIIGSVLLIILTCIGLLVMMGRSQP